MPQPETNTPLLHIRDLSMWYGSTQALRGLNLSVYRGDIYGLIGPNGAGKTTTLRIVATIQKPSSGTVEIKGKSISTADQLPEIRQQIGYMPDAFGVYEDMTAEEYLKFFAAAYAIPATKRDRLVQDVLALVDLSSKKDTLVDSLSRGTQQRLAISRVLIHDPELLILDEPASGLDPRARVEIRMLLTELQKMGKTILISSHILADMGEICNRVGIIEEGHLLVEDTIDGILKRVGDSSIVQLRVAGQRNDEACALLEGQSWIERVYLEGNVLVIQLAGDHEDAWRIPDLLVRNGFRIEMLKPESGSLERAFLQLTKGTVS